MFTILISHRDLAFFLAPACVISEALRFFVFCLSFALRFLLITLCAVAEALPFLFAGLAASLRLGKRVEPRTARTPPAVAAHSVSDIQRGAGCAVMHFDFTSSSKQARSLSSASVRNRKRYSICGIGAIFAAMLQRSSMKRIKWQLNWCNMASRLRSSHTVMQGESLAGCRLRS